MLLDKIHRARAKGFKIDLNSFNFELIEEKLIQGAAFEPNKENLYCFLPHNSELGVSFSNYNYSQVIVIIKEWCKREGIELDDHSLATSGFNLHFKVPIRMSTFEFCKAKITTDWTTRESLW